MKKSDIDPMPEYFDRYINLVGDVELAQAFDESLQQLDALDRNLLTKLDGARYAPDKWTVKEVFQHLIDWERIFAYRALLFARREGSPPQGIDETRLAATMNADRRGIGAIIEDLKSARRATTSLFASFDEAMLKNLGVCWKYEMPVLAVGFLAVGHQRHHLKIVEEKYYPLAS